ncbi:hypothetical protein JHK82_055269 [Glycine max]|uniref:Aspartyl/Glutamyl-tRNA(Gln) amidotransferase subunit B/E catalytic domain-containing protein n=1 Tax=Glycine max TaxID=3847 RepID=K7N1G0_SOYBN|nr:hypothetical protein JHK86_055106 [Glycine max]KAG4917796.1 hypothetical protein JHK85_056077 [Glycine max]KAG5073897.1 hypothetical protein JHK84_055128 [Glycine max]KAG5076574.1 hypothetical protein JHK82_055269 [Glycine max]KAH1034473.1 hypothetical protein GYH30_054759 [Glycine max]
MVICLWQVEIKNLNSFSSVIRAIHFEISRQVQLHSEGQEDQIVQETPLWEEGSSQASAILTIATRKKERLGDYQYFAEPDLPTIILSQEYVDGIKNSLPELLEIKQRR